MTLNLNEEIILIEKEKIIDDLNLKKDDLIFISGSLIEGIGNRYSDLDIFILTSNFNDIKMTKFDYQNIKNIKTLFKTYFGKKCDIEVYDLKIINECLEILNSTFDKEKRIHNIFSEIQTDNFLSFIHRLLTGKCINNEREFNNLISKVNKENYFFILKTMHQNEIDNKYEDLLGNLEERNIGTCVLIGNLIISTLISYHLVKNCISIDRKKWGYLKLKELAKSNNESQIFLKEIENFLFLKVPLKNYAENLIRFINDVVE